MGLRVVVGLDGERVASHAARLIRALAREELRHPRTALPIGIACAAARFMNTCDDCGTVFWAADQWAKHTRCPGGPGRKVGF